MKDQYSDMIAVKAGSSRINDDADDHDDNDDDDVNDEDQSDQDFIVNRCCKTVVAIPDRLALSLSMNIACRQLSPISFASDIAQMMSSIL